MSGHNENAITVLLLLSLLFGFMRITFAAPVISETDTPPEQLPERLKPDRFPLLLGPHPGSDSAPQPATPSGGYHISWTRAAYQRYVGQWEIYFSKVNGTSVVQLTNNGAADIQPDLNRGGNLVTFASDRDGDFEIWRVTAAGHDRRKLTDNKVDDIDPSWAPDGNRIVYESVVNGQSDIFVMNSDGSGKVRVTDHPDYDGMPAWSPDGNRIAFVSRRTGGYRLYIMNADGSNLQMKNSQPYTVYPTWSPKGDAIAFSADSNGDGWFDLWRVDLASGQERQLKRGLESLDYIANSWSPDGRHVAYTLLQYYLYEGQYYLRNSTFGVGYDPLMSANRVRQLSWRSLDKEPPTSTVQQLPNLSPARFKVMWSGVENGESGFRYYIIQVREGENGPWSNWMTETTETEAWFHGEGGRQYAFRSLAVDRAYNVEPPPPTPDAVTTVESWPPQTSVFSLPRYSRPGTNGLPISWGGVDPGGSGIATYDVDVQINGGVWQPWIEATTETTARYEGDLGDELGFRVRASDQANNLEPWPVTPDTTTTLYAWGVEGTVYDTAGTPIPGIEVAIQPSTLSVFEGRAAGKYGAYSTAVSDSYTVTWRREGYGSLPLTTFSRANASQNVHLPPLDNQIVDGHFESGSLASAWTSSAFMPPTVVGEPVHTGAASVRLGSPTFFESIRHLSTESGSSDSPALAIAPDGMLHVTWRTRFRNESGLVAQIHHLLRHPDGTWSAPATIGPPTERALTPDTLVTADGTLHLLWQADYPGTSSSAIFYTQRTPSGNWLERERTTWSALSQEIVEFRVDSSGGVHLVGLPGPFYAYRSPQGDWSSIPDLHDLLPGLNPDTSYSTNLVALEVDSADNVHILFSLFGGYGDNEVAEIALLTRTAGGQWQARPSLTGMLRLNLLQSFVLEVDSQDRLHAFLNYGSRWPGDTYYSNISDSEWSEPLWLLRQSDGARNLFVLLDREDTLHLAWNEGSQYDPGGLRLLYMIRSSRGGWSTPYNLHPPLTPAFQTPILSTDGERVFLTALEQVGEDQGILNLRWQDERGEWSAWSPVDPELIHSEAVDHAIDRNGTLQLVWVDDHGLYPDPTPEVHYTRQRLSPADESSAISQSVTLTMPHPALSFVYQLADFRAADGSRLIAEVDDGQQTTPVFEGGGNGEVWQHGWASLEAWAGERVTVTLRMAEVAGQPVARAYVDEVTVGTVYPELWVAAPKRHGLPGEEVVVELVHGNQGASPAEDVQLTYTLPTGATFVNADPAPAISENVLTWSRGDLSGEQQETIRLTLHLPSDVELFKSLRGTFVVDSSSAETVTNNNRVDSLIYVGKQLWLPTIAR